MSQTRTHFVEPMVIDGDIARPEKSSEKAQRLCLDSIEHSFKLHVNELVSIGMNKLEAKYLIIETLASLAV